jgi:hypothetical protein
VCHSRTDSKRRPSHHQTAGFTKSENSVFTKKKRAINYKTIKNIFSALHNFDFKKNVIGETRLGGFKKTSQIRPV